MNVNAAGEGMRVSRLQTAQPDDPRDDRIAARRVRLQNFSGETAIMKDRADRRVIANFLSDLEEAERSRHSTPVNRRVRTSKSKRDKLATCVPPCDQHQFLILHANDHAIWTPARRRYRREREQSRNEQSEKREVRNIRALFIRICRLSRRNCRAARAAPK